MKHILVLQWTGSTKSDFEALLEMEATLGSRIGEAGFVDGRDFGSGEMNMFIETDQPAKAFAAAKAILGDQPGWRDVRAAFRVADEETYSVLWPPDLTHFHLV